MLLGTPKVDQRRHAHRIPTTQPPHHPQIPAPRDLVNHHQIVEPVPVLRLDPAREALLAEERRGRERVDGHCGVAEFGVELHGGIGNAAGGLPVGAVGGDMFGDVGADFGLEAAVGGGVVGGGQGAG